MFILSYFGHLKSRSCVFCCVYKFQIVLLELILGLFVLVHYEGKVKSSSLTYNRREIQDKRILGRDTDRSWCHRHTSVKLFWSQPMAPWTSVAVYESAVAQSMDPFWIPGTYLMSACPEFHVSCRLDRELFSLPVCCHR